MQHLWYLSQISLLPMLLLIQIINKNEIGIQVMKVMKQEVTDGITA